MSRRSEMLDLMRLSCDRNLWAKAVDEVLESPTSLSSISVTRSFPDSSNDSTGERETV